MRSPRSYCERDRTPASKHGYGAAHKADARSHRTRKERINLKPLASHAHTAPRAYAWARPGPSCPARASVPAIRRSDAGKPSTRPRIGSRRPRRRRHSAPSPARRRCDKLDSWNQPVDVARAVRRSTSFASSGSCSSYASHANISGTRVTTAVDRRALPRRPSSGIPLPRNIPARQTGGSALGRFCSTPIAVRHVDRLSR
jgi:hypothetical protein